VRLNFSEHPLPKIRLEYVPGTSDNLFAITHCRDGAIGVFAAAIDCQVSETLLMEILMKQFSKIVVALSIALSSQLVGAASSETELFGEVVTSSPSDRTVAISEATSFVNVTGGESIKFVVGDKAFSWRFDGKAGAVKLSEIAPNGFGGKDVTIYVAPNPMYSG
jgi:hypothetical protein